MKTATLETSKKLQEAGIDVDTQFNWLKSHITSDCIRVFEVSENDLELFSLICPAPTFDECWQLLPHVILIGGERAVKELNNKAIGYYSLHGDDQEFSIEDNIAEACAQLALWLKSNGHL